MWGREGGGGGGEEEKKGKTKQNHISLNKLGIILESALIVIFCLVAETKGQMFHGIPGF